MNKGIEFKQLLSQTNLSDGRSIERYAVQLKGMTFRDVLQLGITPPGSKDRQYGDARYKGGMGTLLEERYFGYKANSDELPDFPEAGVELKATCFDVRDKGQRISAGERLSLTNIHYDRPIELDFDSSYLWKKCSKILLVYYQRDKTIDKYDQKIEYVCLFTPPEEDLKIIRDDYEKIASYIRSGRADELSESLTTYLGAATKGATEARSWVDQYYPCINEDGTLVHKKAKKRAFSFKRQYMDFVLNHYLKDERSDSDPIVDSKSLEHATFEEVIASRIATYIGKTDKELAEEFGMGGKTLKDHWAALVYKMLGVRSNKAREFIKAGISARAIRIEEKGNVKESLSLNTIDFLSLSKETWETSELRTYLEETRFFFVVFRKCNGEYHLTGSAFWNIPMSDLDNEVQRCWKETQQIICEGVVFTKQQRQTGCVVHNNLPGMASNKVAHVRPKSGKRAYRLHDDMNTSIGVLSDASELPDGQWMTTQSFWLNNSYILKVLSELNLIGE